VLAAALVFAGCGLGRQPEEYMLENPQEIESPNKITISPNEVFVAPGGKYSSFKVAPANGGVSWYIIGQDQEQTSTHFAKSVLDVDEGETASSLTVYARLSADTSIKSNEVTVHITTPLVHLRLYVSSNGNDTSGVGTEAKPFATIGKALEKVATIYADSSNPWPLIEGEGATEKKSAEIILLGPVTSASSATLAGNYPPLTLRAKTSNPSGGDLILTEESSLVTMDTDVTLTLRNITLKGRGLSGGNSNPLVTVSNGHLVLKDGAIITGNNNSHTAGGVYVTGETLTMMQGGAISGNKGSEGGGVGVTNGIFIMQGGTINGNECTGSAGGVNVATTGTFTMQGGTISGNKSSEGGGVRVAGNGVFTKSGSSIIYGGDEGDDLSNKADDNKGNAVYINRDPTFWSRNSTAGAGVDLDSTKDDSAGGWVQ
jgi:hypothetical protein